MSGADGELPADTEDGARFRVRVPRDFPLHWGYPAAREQLTAMMARFPAHQWDDGLPAAPPLPSLTGFLPGLAAPALILGGALDVAGYRDIVAVLAREIPNAEREEFAGCGHLLNLERPTRFTGRLLRFLACHA